MKKILALIMSLVLCLGMVTSVNAATMKTTVESNSVEMDSRAVSLSTTFSVSTGSSWSKSFTTNKILAEDHNAFKVVISDFSGGSYKYIIKGSNGYEYTSSEKTTGATFTTTNANSGVTYTIYIVNTSAKTISGSVKVSSYYNN